MECIIRGSAFFQRRQHVKLPILFFLVVIISRHILSNHIFRQLTTVNVTDTKQKGKVTNKLEKRLKPIDPHRGHKKVLVTGAAGFIGSHVADLLLKRGDDVVGVDEMNSYYDVRVKEENLAILHRTSNTRRGSFKMYRGDCANKSFISTVFKKEQPRWVCHLAARAGVRHSMLNPYIYIHSNIVATAQLMELSVEYNITNFIYASSFSVYGGSTSQYFRETESINSPSSPYAASKKSAELLAHTWHHLYGLHTTGLRFFTVYGPRGRPDMAAYIFMNGIVLGKTILKYGDGSSSRDYTYIDDVADGVIRAIDRPYQYMIFNLGHGNATELKLFIDLVEKYARKKASVQQVSVQPGDVSHTCADVTEAKYYLGYRARVGIEEGIQKMFKWYDNPGSVLASA